MTPERCWIAHSDEPAAAPDAQAALLDPVLDAPAGYLAAWFRASKPVRAARRVDSRIIDARGEAALCSLVWPALGRLLIFDDPAVQQARRAVLAGPPADAVSTVLTDDSHFAGAITVRRGPGAGALLRDDPFARIQPARVLRIGPGLFGSAPAPCGPTIERHGSAQPWPWPVF